MAARKARKSTSRGSTARKRPARSTSAGAKKAKRTSSAGKKAASKKKAKPATKKVKKVKKVLARKPTRAAPKKAAKRAAPKRAAAKKKVKRAAPKKAVARKKAPTRKAATRKKTPARKSATRKTPARKTAARKKAPARKAATRKVAAKKKLKKVTRPAPRKAKKAVRKTTRRVTAKAAKPRATKRVKAPARKAKSAKKKTTRTTARKSVTRAKATRKLRAAAPARTKKTVRGAKKGAARKTALDARARRKLALAERKAAAKLRAREAAKRKLEKKLALKAKKEAAAAKKLARKLAAKEAKARAMEAVRARRAKLAEAKARKKAAEAEARAAAKKQAKEAAAAAKAAAKAAKLARGRSEAPAGDHAPLRVGTSRSKLLHGEGLDRKSRTGASSPPGAGQKGKSTSPPARGSTPPNGVARTRVPVMRPVLPTIPIEPPKPTLEERAAQVSQRLESQNEEVRKEYEDRLFMSWIHHDSALEGVVYSFHELQIAIDPSITVVPDSSMQPVCDEIRRHKQALDFVRDAATKKRQPVTTDIVKRIYLILHPEEGDLKTVKYRKDIPQHRLYFHEYAPPDKIAYLVRQVVEWVNDPETRRTRTTLRIAARAHYDLLRAFPFPNDSGKVARLFMNFLLLRAGYPPAIIHSTERQRYYEALKGSPLAIVHMVQEALENSIASIDKFLDERTTRVRSFVS